MEERKVSLASLGLTRRVQRSASAQDALKGVDLNRNIEALIENPLSHLTPDELQKDARSFARLAGLEAHQDLVEKGARIAKDPQYYEVIPGLTDDEKEALRNERRHRFRQPKQLYLTIIICSIGAAVQGWDQTGSNGANLNWPQAFGLEPDRNSNDFWILGLVNAAPYLAAALIGCWLSHPLNHHLGRRGTIFFAAVFCLLPVFGSACTQTWVQLFICRLLLGVGMGAKASTIPVLAAENSPASIRGSLVMGWQLWVAFGIFLGFTANLILYQIGPIAWRLQLGSAFIPAVPLLIGIYFCPESPRWYIKKHRYRDAFISLCRLRNTPVQAARDLYYIHAQVRLEEMMLGDGDIIISDGEEYHSISGRYFTRLLQLFTIVRIRRATLAAFVVMIAQQMCGINIMAFYSSTLFVDAHASERSALLVSWGFGLINFAFAWPAVWSIDRFGRRALLLFTFPHMAWTLLAAGFCFYIPADSPARLGLITLFVYLFAAFYSPGEGPVPFTYSAEAFPLFHREVGMSLAVSINLFWAAVLTVIFPKLIDALTPTGAIGLFAGLNVVAFVMIFLWVPETKQRTLEELDYIFAVPTSKHMNYQITKSPTYYHASPDIVRLCASIQEIIDDQVSSHPGLGESNLKPFRIGLQDLSENLAFFERVRALNEPKLDIEDTHLRDSKRSEAEASGQEPLWKITSQEFIVAKFYMGFYKRALEMSLIFISLIRRLKGRDSQDNIASDRGNLSEAAIHLRLSVIQRRNLTGGSDHEESVEEMGLLRDIEQCVKSAEKLLTVDRIEKHDESRLHARSPTGYQNRSLPDLPPRWLPEVPIRDGSLKSSLKGSSASYGTTENYLSDDSETESVDYEPDQDAGFSAEVYQAMITALLRELREKMNGRNYHEAEEICKTIMKHSKDRESKLGISFDGQAEVDLAFAEIYVELKRYQKAKKIAIHLLQNISIDADCRFKLHLLLARAYIGRDQLSKAESYARSSLRGREAQHGREHPLTMESASLLIEIYERQGDVMTAGVLKDIYCPPVFPLPPPKSALRVNALRLASPSTPSPSRTQLSSQEQSMSENNEASHAPSENRVRWAPDVWVNESSINAPMNELGQTPLIYAIHQKDEAYVKLNIERGAHTEKTCADGINPLMHAATLGTEAIVEALLKAGAKVDSRTAGWTPLHQATEARNLAIMKLLLTFGADVEAQSPFEYIKPVGSSAKARAMAHHEPDREVESEDPKWTPLLRAANQGDEAAVALLLDSNADIEARSPIQATPLTYACRNLHHASADLLSLRGANIHAVDTYGWTPLHHAVINNALATRSKETLPILALLLSHEADPNARCNFGKTALHYAVEKGAAEIASFLLANRADVEARDIAELTPLHTAIKARSVAMVALLLELGADSGAMDAAGDDALQAAKHADKRSPEIIMLLDRDRKVKKERRNAERNGGRGVGERKGSFATIRSRRGSASASGAGDTLTRDSKKKRWFGGKSGKGKDDG